MSRNPLIVCVLLVMFSVFADSATQEDLENAFWNFAVHFQKTAVRIARPEENLLFSPLGVYINLAIMHIGASGDTREELNEILGLPDMEPHETLDVFHHRLSVMVNRAQGSGDGAISLININSAAFVQLLLGAKNGFREEIEKYYGGTTMNIDFHNNRTTINLIRSWAKDRSHGEISSLYLPIPQDTQMLFVTTSLFEAEWEKPFPKTGETMEPFETNSPEPTQARMMRSVMSVIYGHNKKLQIEYIGIPYVGGRYFMYVILPDDNERLDDVIDRMNVGDLRKILKTGERDIVDVKIPMMKFGWAEFVDDHLESLGLKSLVQNPNFNRMINRGSVDNIRVYQATQLEVNHAGTSVRPKPADISQFHLDTAKGKRFYANRPFLMYIYHKDTSSILFTAAVYDPAKWRIIS